MVDVGPKVSNKGILDAWCIQCQEVRQFRLLDPGSCKCGVCGHVEVLTRPLKPGEQVRG